MKKETTAGMSMRGRPDPTDTTIKPGLPDPMYARPYNDNELPDVISKRYEVSGPVNTFPNDIPEEARSGQISIAKNLREKTYSPVGDEGKGGASHPFVPKGRR